MWCCFTKPYKKYLVLFSIFLCVHNSVLVRAPVCQLALTLQLVHCVLVNTFSPSTYLLQEQMLFKILSSKCKQMEKPYFTRNSSLFNKLVKPIIVLPLSQGQIMWGHCRRQNGVSEFWVRWWDWLQNPWARIVLHIPWFFLYVCGEKTTLKTKLNPQSSKGKSSD